MRRCKVEEYITPAYETIGVSEKRHLCEMLQSSLINAFTEEDYLEVMCVFRKVINRLEDQCGEKF